MGVIPVYRPQFLAASSKDFKFEKVMFVRKGAKAYNVAGDLSRDCYGAELICISNETEDEWIGNYAEGFGFFGVHFLKEDCRDASDEEIQKWVNDRDGFKY